MSEKSRMLNGESYHAADPKLVWERDRAARVLHTYNKRTFHEIDRHNRLLRKLLHTEGNFWIKPPFHCDYGYNIYIGNNVMLNYGCVLLDVNPIVIGEDTLIGPNTQIYTAYHAMDSIERKNGVEFGKPVHIGKNVWIGGSTVILPGVTIGDHAVIGAGSVVTHDIEANTVAYGNPCRPQKDKLIPSENHYPGNMSIREK